MPSSPPHSRCGRRGCDAVSARRELPPRWDTGTQIDDPGLADVGRAEGKRSPGLFISQCPLCQQRRHFHQCLALGSILYDLTNRIQIASIFREAGKYSLAETFEKCAGSWRGRWVLRAKAVGSCPNCVSFSKMRMCPFSDLGPRCLPGMKY